MKKEGLVILAIVVLVATGYFVRVSQAETKYLKKEEVNKTMVQWNKDLGVKCSFCHTSPYSKTYEDLVGEEVVVSEEELKALVRQSIAKSMLATMLYLNKKENKNYTCNTCHQGRKDVEISEGNDSEDDDSGDETEE